MMGQHPSAVYAAIYQGKGPLLTEVTPAPFTYPEPKSKRSRYVQLLAAVEWLERRPDAEKWRDVIRALRVEWVMSHLRRGVRLPPPAQAPSALARSTASSFHLGRFRRARAPRAALASSAYAPRTDGLLT